MKQKKKGFTLVELVIVIAVIAILAGVMIAVFANVVNKANESAKLQDEKQAEIQQKLEDIEKKLENQNWLGWEDFENELATQLAEANQNNEAATIAAIDAALDEFTKKYASGDTGLTEDQVKTIIERALSGQLTEEQVKQIVTAAVKNSGNELTAAQISQIISKALANQLTVAQVQTVVADALKGITTDISELKANALDEAAIQKIIEAALPVTKEINASATQSDIDAIVASLNNGSTLYLTGDWSAKDVTVAYDSNKTLYIRGSKVNTLTVNAPAGTIGIYVDANTVDIQAILTASAHVYGIYGDIRIARGRLVLESTAKITRAVEAVPTAAASVELKVSANVTVPTLKVTNSGLIEITNNGVVAAVEVTKSGSSAVIVENSTNATFPETVVVNGTDGIVAEKTEESALTINGSGAVALTNDNIVATLAAATSGKVYKLTEDITLTRTITIPMDVNVVLDTNGYTISKSTLDNTPAFTVRGYLTIKGNGVINCIHNRAVLVYGTFVLDGATIQASATEETATISSSTSKMYENIGWYGTISVDAGCFVMNSGKLSSSNIWYAVEIGSSNNATEYIMNGGTIEAEYALFASNCNFESTRIVVNGGTMRAEKSNTMYLPCNKGYTEINGGTIYAVTSIEGQSGIDICGGELVINGGVFKATGAKGEGAIVSGQSSNIASALVLVDEKSTSYKLTSVTINGGTFISQNEDAVSVYKGTSKVNESSKLTITGGTFSSDVSAFVASGYTYDATTGTVSKN